jgi:hypothetical protein
MAQVDTDEVITKLLRQLGERDAEMTGKPIPHRGRVVDLCGQAIDRPPH